MSDMPNHDGLDAIYADGTNKRIADLEHQLAECKWQRDNWRTSYETSNGKRLELKQQNAELVAMLKRYRKEPAAEVSK